MKAFAITIAAAGALLFFLEPLALADEEQAIDLDSLEDTKAETGNGTQDQEPLLPFKEVSNEVERHGLLTFFVLALLIPATAMLFPPRRSRRNPTADAHQNQPSDHKEN